MPKCICAKQAEFQLFLPFTVSDNVTIDCVIMKGYDIFDTCPDAGFNCPSVCRLLCSGWIRCDWQTPMNNLFHKGFTSSLRKSRKIIFALYPFKSQICTCHNSWAVITCANWWSDHIIISSVAVTCVYEICIMGSWPFSGMGLSASLINGDYSQLAGN